MTNTSRQIRGGWRFPVTFQDSEVVPEGQLTQSSIAVVAGDDDIRQSISVLLQTQPGERIMRPTYGCDLQSVMFANMDDGLMADVMARIHESITTFEPRAQDLTVVVDKDPERTGHLHVMITYRHIDSGVTQRVSGKLAIVEGLRGEFQ